jgi:hypothetical protein
VRSPASPWSSRSRTTHRIRCLPWVMHFRSKQTKAFPVFLPARPREACKQAPWT